MRRVAVIGMVLAAVSVAAVATRERAGPVNEQPAAKIATKAVLVPANDSMVARDTEFVIACLDTIAAEEADSILVPFESRHASYRGPLAASSLLNARADGTTTATRQRLNRWRLPARTLVKRIHERSERTTERSPRLTV